MRTLLVAVTLFVMTLVLGSLVLLVTALGLAGRSRGLFDWAARTWARSLLAAAGVRLVLHDAERMQHEGAHIYVSNHVSWFDVFALATVLPRYRFIAKAELFRIPLFGPAARAVGTIPIDRGNRKAAFESYREAAEKIHGGDSVVVYPEGTRGYTYALRPFKKGPFVLAIAAQAPIVPTVIHGTIAVHRKKSPWIHAGRVDVHFLEPVPTAGLGYDDRERLMRTVWQRMADALRAGYGVESDAAASRATSAA